MPAFSRDIYENEHHHIIKVEQNSRENAKA